ncbi:hypothetical protein BHE74_00056359 [Ensete ventricosum]|uniref:Uncharacterized protein n=1 Tax=Ensete ventricosum TaxID=4639 RepID=A0A444FTF1_ENSVE|nr:hypothetical protein GW17_00009791 [Ensete ventricosum]RWW38423.1 hypothetical protein BHE74_00056359 [Ensete ventricosum]RZR74436.1 hypothetical protein BHM03_00036945 [Ensete ventricosum]
MTRKLTGSEGGGFGILLVVENGLCEHERAVFGLLEFVAVVLGGAEVDAGAALKGGEEGGRHARSYPHRHPFQLPVGRHHALGVILRRHLRRPLPDLTTPGFASSQRKEEDNTRKREDETEQLWVAIKLRRVTYLFIYLLLV